MFHSGKVPRSEAPRYTAKRRHNQEETFNEGPKGYQLIIEGHKYTKKSA
jgi:hypothetical protein